MVIDNLHEGIQSITLETRVIDVLVKTRDNAQPHAIAASKEELHFTYI